MKRHGRGLVWFRLSVCPANTRTTAFRLRTRCRSVEVPYSVGVFRWRQRRADSLRAWLDTARRMQPADWINVTWRNRRNEIARLFLSRPGRIIHSAPSPTEIRDNVGLRLRLTAAPTKISSPLFAHSVGTRTRTLTKRWFVDYAVN